MGKLISLGEYNKLYKYIWIYLAIKFVANYFFKYNLVFEQFKIDAFEIIYGTFISLQLNYIGFIIISLILIFFKSYCKKKENVLNKTSDDTQLIYNEMDIKTEFGLTETDFFYL